MNPITFGSNTFTRPSTPKMTELRTFALTEAGKPGNDENDVWTKTAEKAHELGKEAPSQLDIRRVLTQDMQRRFPGLDIGSPFANHAIQPHVPVVAPKAKSSKRSASEVDELEIQTSIAETAERATARGARVTNAIKAAKRQATDSLPVRLFSPFSHANLKKTFTEAVELFNDGLPEDRQIKYGTLDYTKAQSRHNARRSRAGYSIT
jgi:hypothetical protein